MAATLTVREAAEILNCVPETVRRMCRRGDLKFIKLGSAARSAIRVVINQPAISQALGEEGMGALVAAADATKMPTEEDAFFA